MNPQVKLVSNLSNARQSLSFAAKLCYGQENEEITATDRDNLLIKILEAKHWSILEHANASFYITNVSRNFTHQFVRHRHMSFAQQSFHYTVAKDMRIPALECDKLGLNDLMEAAFRHAFDFYNELIKKGMPKEEARHVLPTGLATKIVATANIREWVQFVSIRTCSVNCMEIREVAIQIRKILVNELHILEKYLGPSCYINGQCFEGKKCCGKSWKKEIPI